LSSKRNAPSSKACGRVASRTGRKPESTIALSLRGAACAASTQTSLRSGAHARPSFGSDGARPTGGMISGQRAAIGSVPGRSPRPGGQESGADEQFANVQVAVAALCRPILRARLPGVSNTLNCCVSLIANRTRRNSFRVRHAAGQTSRDICARKNPSRHYDPRQSLLESGNRFVTSRPD
jgi:hypothetical protein